MKFRFRFFIPLALLLLLFGISSIYSFPIYQNEIAYQLDVPTFTGATALMYFSIL